MDQYKRGTKTIALNNTGVSYIESEDYYNAIKLLKRALKRCPKVVSTIERRQNSNKNMQNNEDEDSDSYHLDSWMSDRNRTRRRSSINKSKDTDASASLLSSESMIHRRTIVIPPKIPESKAHMVPVAIIFNLALAYQLCAIENNNDSSLLRMAVELYDHVLDYHLTIDTPMSTCMVFIMSCLNNMGQIYKTLGDKDMENFFFDKLLSVLMCMVDYFPSEERPYNLDVFFQSTMHLILPSCSIVAAAA